MRPQTKEEGDLETQWSWMEVGGLPAKPEEEAWGLLLEVFFGGFPCGFLLLSTFLLLCFFLLLGVGFVGKGGQSTRRGPEVGD